MGDFFMAVSIIGDSGFAEYRIMGDSFMAVSVIGDSGFAEYDIIGDSFIAVSIIGDSGFAEYGIMGDSIMAVSIIGDSGSVFLPLYTKFRYRKVSAPSFPTDETLPTPTGRARTLANASRSPNQRIAVSRKGPHSILPQCNQFEL
jgi:hypothetical protein